jgi:hypothetical protein
MKNLNQASKTAWSFFIFLQKLKPNNIVDNLVYMIKIRLLEIEFNILIYTNIAFSRYLRFS